MAEEPATADDLAAAIADGRPVDWDALMAHADTPEARLRVDRFAFLARIAGVHNGRELDTSPPTANPPLAADLPDYRPGDRWGPLHIVERLASGTFGTVYRAHDPALARDVALKILHVPATGEPLAVDAVAEGRLLARVRHPHVVSVYGADQYDGRVGLWMDLIEGRTLEDELQSRGPLPAAEVMAVGADLAHALQAVHAAGLLHRDLKTQNVMLDARDGRVVLMDFSAGREQIDVGLHGAWPATIAGSPVYLAPEILAGVPASVRSDVYSLGVVLFRMLTHRFPVEGHTLDELDQAHRSQRKATVRDVRPDVPEGLARIVDRSLAADPLARPSGAREVADALTATAPETKTARIWARISAAVLLVLVLAAGVLFWRQRAASQLVAESLRHSVLVADAPDGAEAGSDNATAQALARELKASASSLPTSRITAALALMRQPADAPLDQGRAREVSLRDGGVRAILQARAVRLGNALVLTTRVVRPGDGATVATVSQEVPRMAVTLDDLRDHARQVHTAVADASPTLPLPDAPLAKVTTSSLEAAELYTRAAAVMAGDAWVAPPAAPGPFASADALLQRAIELDSDFASAWLLRSRSAVLGGRLIFEANVYAERALALVSSVSNPERYLIEGLAGRMRADQAFSRADLEEAARSFEALLQITPNHHWALLELEPLYRRLGRIDDAERVALRGAALRPDSIKLAALSAHVHLAHRDRRALEQVATRTLAAAPPELRRGGGELAANLTWLELWRASDAWMARDAKGVHTELLRVLERAGANAAPSLRRTALHVLHGLGRFDDARRLAAELPEWDRKFATALTDGRQERWAALDPVLTPGFGDPAVHRQRFSFIYLWAGRLDDAERLLGDYRTARVPRNWQELHEFEGELRLAQGRFGDALGLLTPLLADERAPRLRAHESEAVARRGVGDLAGAIGGLEHFDRHPEAALLRGWSGFDWLRCQVRLAEYYVEAGRATDAARVAATVRAHVALADADHPFAARLARLP
jgi:tetratricopeptide (TPR) repeat protein